MAALNSHANDLSRLWKGAIFWDCPMSTYSTLKVGGPAEALIVAEKPDELLGLIRWLEKNRISWQIIGRGSNILVPDEGLPGVVIILGKGFSEIEPIYSGVDRMLVRAGAGGSLAKLVSFCKTVGLTGLEFTVGIPGSVGGAIMMNAGAYGWEIGNLVNSIEIITPAGLVQELTKDKLQFSYRQLAGIDRSIISSCTFNLVRESKKTVAAQCREYADRRRRQQPQGVASVGSFFKNPPGQAAGRLIEQAGLKGRKIGGAMISLQHANFIINTGSAAARDFFELMQEVQVKVFERFGIMLEPEVQILGKEDRTQTNCISEQTDQ